MENRRRTELVKLGDILNKIIGEEKTKVLPKSPPQSFCEKCGGLNLAIELAQLCNLLDPEGELNFIDPLNPINTIQNIKLVVKYLLFSIEASERQNECLRKLLKNHPPLESPDD